MDENNKVFLLFHMVRFADAQLCVFKTANWLIIAANVFVR